MYPCLTRCCLHSISGKHLNRSPLEFRSVLCVCRMSGHNPGSDLKFPSVRVPNCIHNGLKSCEATENSVPQRFHTWASLHKASCSPYLAGHQTKTVLHFQKGSSICPCSSCHFFNILSVTFLVLSLDPQIQQASGGQLSCLFNLRSFTIMIIP